MPKKPVPAPRVRDARGRFAASGFRAGDRLRLATAGWQPVLASADRAWLWGRDTAVARARDLVRNHAHARAGVARRTDMVAGAGLVFRSTPDAAGLGISQEAARQLGQQIERAFWAWAADPFQRCDAEEVLSFGGMLALACADRHIAGEALAVLRWRPGEWGGASGWATRLQMISPDRLSNPNDALDSDTLRGGVELSPLGAPVAYHIRQAHPADAGYVSASPKVWQWERVARRQPWGRPQVCHYFRREEAGQSRGISSLVQVIEPLKTLSRYAEAELASAAVSGLYSAVITSDQDNRAIEDALGVEDAARALAMRETAASAYYDAARLRDQAGGKIARLFPGDDLKFVTGNARAADFGTFTSVFLREIASALDLSYEQLAMDWSQTNYSSARAALVEVWRTVTRERAELVQQLAQPVLYAVLEEAIDAGRVAPPPGCAGLDEMPTGWLAGNWRGPGRGWVDPVKEAEAAASRMAQGLSTLEAEAAEQGADWEEIAEQRARERAYYVALRLPDPQDPPEGPAPRQTPPPADPEELPREGENTFFGGPPQSGDNA